MALPLTGRCACGDITYETPQEPGFSFFCHCRQCQRASGNGHSAAFIVDEATTKITGSLSFFSQISDSGNTVRRGFCSNCGSPVMNKNTGHPDSLFICAATLDDVSRFRASAHVFVESAPPWDYATE